MQIRVSGPDGKPIRPVMGCYGIGVERAMATVVEVHYDAKGIIWPVAVAPFEVVVVVAQQDYVALADAGVDVIVDDRPVRAGVKFSDAELVGIPFRVTIGKRGLAAGTAELTERESGTTVQIPLADLAAHVREAIAKSLVANR
jgi:prolyl-tRNA synthetase